VHTLTKQIPLVSYDEPENNHEPLFNEDPNQKKEFYSLSSYLEWIIRKADIDLEKIITTR